MNFLFLNSASRGWGGNEKSISIAASLLKNEHQAILAYRKSNIGKNFHINKYQLPFISEFDIYTIIKIINIVKKHKIDIIIPSKRKDYFLAGIASRICGIKNVLWLGEMRDLKNRQTYNIVFNKLADGIIVNAKAIKDTLLKSDYMKAHKIKVIYSGIDIENILSATTGAKGKDPSLMTITSMGRLDKNKSHRFLIESFNLFLTYNKNIKSRLVIIGDGPEKNDLMNFSKQLNIENKIQFTGFLDNPYPLLCDSDVFTMTSVTEGLSIALLESMFLQNAPVSTYAGGGVTEIIKDGKNGFLITYGNSKQLADVLYLLHENPELRKKIASAAREQVIEQFSTDKMKSEIVSFLQSLITSDLIKKRTAFG
jgi:glycosyltransferase involved in cell wall biosynthesis